MHNPEVATAMERAGFRDDSHSPLMAGLHQSGESPSRWKSRAFNRKVRQVCAKVAKRRGRISLCPSRTLCELCAV